MRRALRFLAILGVAGSLWGGQELPGQPGDETVPNQLIVRLDQRALPGLLPSLVGTGVVTRLVNSKLNLHLVHLPTDRASDIAAHPLVRYVEPNRIRRATVGAPTDPYYAASQYALHNVQAFEAWRLLPNRYLTAATAGAGRIRVAVLDTGVDCTHPDFTNSGGSSTDSAFGGQLNWSLSQALVPTTLPAPACPWQDDHWHGTHTAGTVAAATNNALGVASLGYPLELIIYKVLDASGSGTDVTIADAIVRAADAGASVVSMSLGGAGYSQALQDAISYACQRNVLVVASAGNSNSSGLVFPAGANCAVGVAATDSANNKASFSNYGDSIDIAAPGVSVLSTYPDSGYAQASGTSMAAPHVAALAGLIAMSTPNVASAAVLQRIQETATSANPNGGWHQYFGYGVINAWRGIGGTMRAASVGSVVGQVVNDMDDPVGGAQVAANGQNVTTGASGLFRIANLTAGTYVATATASGFPAQSRTIVVAAGVDTPLTFRMGVGLGVFTGAVTDMGTPVPRAVVQAVTGGLIAGTALSDTNGIYTLAVPAGSYDLRASAVSRVTAVVSGQSVAASGTQTVNLSLAKMGSITGLVRDSAQNPIPDAQITVTGSSFTAGAVTDASGNYATIGLPAGTYSVSAEASGWQGGTVDGVVVSVGSVSRVDFGASPVTVSVSPASVTLAGSQTQQFTATVTGTANQSVTWSRSPALGSISAAGLYTAPSSFSNHTTVTITATSVEHPSRSGSATVTLDNVLTLTLSPTSATGGVSTTANKVTLDDPAPSGGAAVSLSSSDPSVALPPASVTVAAGAQASPSFTITTATVSAATPVTVRATYAGVTKAAVLNVNPVALSAINLNTSAITGGNSFAGNHVHLNGPAPAGGIVVSLASSSPAVASVPASVTVAAGATTSPDFTITTTQVAAATPVTITATYAGVSKSATLTVKPVALYSLILLSSSVAGGVSMPNNKVTLTGPAGPGGAVVSLASSNPAVAAVPASVVVAAGAKNSAYFTITTTEVVTATQVTITATYEGVSKTASLTVGLAALSSLTLSPSSVAGGVATTSNRVRLTGPAAAGGAVVSLTSSNPAVAAVPASVTVAAGATISPYFTITTSLVSAATPVTITATRGGVSKSATLTVNPAALFSLTLLSSGITGGVPLPNNKVTLTGPAGPSGVVVSLASSNPAVAAVPASVTVAAGAKTSPYFTITTTSVAAATPVTITATYAGVSKSATLTVRLPAPSSLTLSPSSVKGGLSTTSNRVRLTGPAGAGGVVVSLASSNPAVASVPSSVTVEAGATTSPYFTITTTAVSSSTPVTITATYGTSKTAVLTVNP